MNESLSSSSLDRSFGNTSLFSSSSSSGSFSFLAITFLAIGLRVGVTSPGESSDVTSDFASSFVSVGASSAGFVSSVISMSAVGPLSSSTGGSISSGSSSFSGGGGGGSSFAFTNSLPQSLFPILFQPYTSMNSARFTCSTFLSPVLDLVVSSMIGVSCVAASTILLPHPSVIKQNFLSVEAVSILNRFTQ